jgi:hypothetical protein
VHLENNLDDRDKKYIEEYSKIINTHSNYHCKFDLDLTKDYTPPKDLFIEVRAVEDIENVKTKLGGKKLLIKL